MNWIKVDHLGPNARGDCSIKAVNFLLQLRDYQLVKKDPIKYYFICTLVFADYLTNRMLISE
jgi:hypothetical protein